MSSTQTNKKLDQSHALLRSCGPYNIQQFSIHRIDIETLPCLRNRAGRLLGSGPIGEVRASSAGLGWFRARSCRVFSHLTLTRSHSCFILFRAFHHIASSSLGLVDKNSGNLLKRIAARNGSLAPIFSGGAFFRKRRVSNESAQTQRYIIVFAKTSLIPFEK